MNEKAAALAQQLIQNADSVDKKDCARGSPHCHPVGRQAGQLDDRDGEA